MYTLVVTVTGEYFHLSEHLQSFCFLGGGERCAWNNNAFPWEKAKSRSPKPKSAEILYLSRICLSSQNSRLVAIPGNHFTTWELIDVQRPTVKNETKQKPNKISKQNWSMPVSKKTHSCFDSYYGYYVFAVKLVLKDRGWAADWSLYQCRLDSKTPSLNVRIKGRACLLGFTTYWYH